jgi:hypothetical protein
MRDFISKLDNILLEGGNIWKDDLATTRINKNDVVPTVKFLEKITGLPLQQNMLGTTGIKDSSGDIDLAVNAKNYNKDELKNKLDQWASKNDPSAMTKKTGVSVHFRTPINGNPRLGYVQTDFMFLDDLPFAKWSMSQPLSYFKGASKHIVLASVAKTLGLKWSFQNGLTNRETGQLVQGGKDPNQVAKILFGPKANAQTISTVENMLAALENDPNKDAKLADAINSIGPELAAYQKSKNITEEKDDGKLSKEKVETLLKNNGYENLKVKGNKIIVLAQIPDGAKKSEFRQSTMQEILKYMQQSVPQHKPHYSDDPRLSSIGGIAFADSNVAILVKDEGQQGDKSAGVANEIELGSIIQSVIEKYGSANVTFTDPKGNKLSIDNATNVDVSGRSTTGRRKADVVIQSPESRLPISIKKVNAEMWESADNLFGKRAKEMIEKLVADGVVELKQIGSRGSIPVYQLSKEIVMEPTEEEALQAIFGSDLNPEGGIVIQTFKPEHFKQEGNNVNVDAHAIIKTKDDIPESHIMYWILRNNKDRNSKSLGIAGIRPLGVTATRAFGKEGGKDVVHVDVEGNVLKGKGDKKTKSHDEPTKHEKWIDKRKQNAKTGVGREKRK